MTQELPFNPFPFLTGSHRQTIIGCLIHWQMPIKSKTKFLDLKDGDQLALEVSAPKEWKETDLTVVMIHGLCGSHKSPYLVRLARKLFKLGIRCVRVNLRGCGSGRGRAKNIYHSGRSEDIFCVLKDLKQEYPHSPMVLMGFSLGGNIVLKLAGELGPLGKDLVQKVISLSPPTDLYSSVEMLGHEKNRFYEKYFLRLLRFEVKYRERRFPEVPKVILPRKMKIMDFDEIYTAPQAGFKSAMDYYEKCSSIWLVPEIEVPCYILFSEDDPIICAHSLDHLKLPANVRLYKTQHGGHLGFLGSPLRGNFHWMDKVLVDWILAEETT